MAGAFVYRMPENESTIKKPVEGPEDALEPVSFLQAVEQGFAGAFVTPLNSAQPVSAISKKAARMMICLFMQLNFCFTGGPQAHFQYLPVAFGKFSKDETKIDTEMLHRYHLNM